MDYARFIQEYKDLQRTKNYIFFEKDQAIKFRKTWSKSMLDIRWKNFKFRVIVKKPKIFVYNLEDFLEDWEDNILGNKWIISRRELKTFF